MNMGMKWIAGLSMAVAALAGGAMALGQSDDGTGMIAQGSAAVDDAIEF